MVEGGITMQNTPATSSTAPRIRQAVRTANAKTAPPALPRAPLLHGLNRAVLWQLAACGTGLLLSAGQVYGGAAPFGLGLLLGCGNTYAPAAALGCLAGLLLFQPLDTALKLAGACIGALTARIVGRQLGQTGFLPGAACGVGVLLLEQGLVTLVGGASPADTASLLCSAALAVLVGLGIHKLHIGTPRGACLWAAMAAACLQRAALPGFAPGLAGAAFCILCCACADSLEHTAVLALVLAMALTAAAPALCFAALAVAAGGLGTAVFCPGERRSGAAVFAAGCALGALAAPNLTGVLTLGLAAGAGLLGFLLCPEQALRAVFPPPAPPVGSQSLTSAARKLSGVADTLSDIAETVNAVCSCQMPPRGESYDYVVEFCAQHLCQNCARRNTCWVQGYSTAMDGLYALRGALDDQVSGVYLASPNFLGGIEDVSAAAEICHAAGAKLIVGANPIALALFKTPGEAGADVCVGDGQPLGMPLSYGGPYVGFMATRTALMRKLPGRIVGQTVDSRGQRCFVLSLQAREQHIRREKASSNICSNEALCALTASVYLSMMGPNGLRQVGQQCYAKAHYLADQLCALPGVTLRYPGPFFHEFVTDLRGPADVLAGLEAKGILGGLPLKDGLLWCVTELVSKAQLDKAVSIVKEVLGIWN